MSTIPKPYRYDTAPVARSLTILGPQTIYALSDNLGIKAPVVRKMLKQMEEANQVRPEPILMKKRGRPMLAWTLVS